VTLPRDGLVEMMGEIMFESIEGFFVVADTCFSIARQYADRETDLVDCRFWLDELKHLIENEFPPVPFVPESELELKREKFRVLKREFVGRCEDVQLADWNRKEKLKSKSESES